MAKKVKPLCPPGKKPKYEDVFFATVPKDDGGTMDLFMDIYQDPSQTEPGPCIIYYFGGGWMWGEYKQVTQKAVYCRDLVKMTDEGYTIVSPAYRLGSDAAFPAAIYDCKAVVRFLKAHADEYHIDPDRIAVLGNSAGGHLAAMVACTSGVPELEGDVGGNLEYDSSVKAAAVFYAPVDIVKCICDSWESIEEAKSREGTEIEDLSDNDDSAVYCAILGYNGEGKDLESLYGIIQAGDKDSPEWHYIELAEKCSPINYVSADCPPMMILHGGQDPVVPISQSENFYRALAAAGADATYLSYSQAGHGPCINEEADEYAYEFLKRHLQK